LLGIAGAHEIESVTIEADPAGHADQFGGAPAKRHPTQVVEAQFAQPFLVATALAHGKVGIGPRVGFVRAGRLLPVEFLVCRRRQTPRVGVRRHRARRVIRPPRRLWSTLRFRRCRHALAAQLLQSCADDRKIVGGAGAGHGSSLRVWCELGCLSAG
jgi:hypothetical protein